MASAVATPLEKQSSTIAGIDSMTSTSALGNTQITIQFTLERNIDAAAQDVQAAIAAAQPQMPPGMPTPPSYKKVNPADQPILYLALSSPTLPLYVVDEYAQTNLSQRISTIAGVAQGQIFGSQKYAGTNTIEVVDSINRILPAFRAQLPASVNLNILYDRSVSIRSSVHDVQFTLLLAIALVVLVIFLFLRNVSATLIPSLALPMSVGGPFLLRHALGYTIDNLSLMALTLAAGFIVDDAIVMLENLVRRMEEGLGRMDAAVLGARAIGF